jgi:serine/threonine protein kinase/tetratricopeptide (TPR) repeat protein
MSFQHHIPGFEIREQIGSGSSGIVYRARKTSLDRDHAIKVLHPPGGGAILNRLREIIALDIKSTHLGVIYDLGQTEDGLAYVDMQYYENGSLRELLKKRALDFQTCIDYARQIAEGLAALHAKGVIHRDLKPENILVSVESGQTVLKIIDFDIARRIDTDTITEKDLISGTWEYMAPEQVRGEACSLQTDIWALGVILYEMISGKSPFRSGDWLATGTRIDRLWYEPLPKEMPAISLALADVVGQCIQKSPERRYRAAEDLLVDLKRLIASPPSYPVLLHTHVRFPGIESGDPAVQSLIRQIMPLIQGELVHHRGVVISAEGLHCKSLHQDPEATLGSAIALQKLAMGRLSHLAACNVELVMGIDLGEDRDTELQKYLEEVQSSGEPGLILLTSTVKAVLDGKSEFHFRRWRQPLIDKFGEDTGVFSVGEITYWDGLVGSIRKHTTAVTATAALVLCIIAALLWLRPSPKPLKLVAILPLQATVQTPEYLKGGLTRVLINCLSQLPDTKVISRSSVERFSGMQWNADSIHDQLNVDGAIQGTIALVGASYSIELKLFAVPGGSEIWTYSDGDTGAASLAPRFARAYAKEFGIQVPEILANRLNLYTTHDAKAFDEYLRGDFEHQKGTMESNALALVFFRRALDRDSLYIPALNYLAAALHVCYEREWGNDPQVLEEASGYCERVLALDSLNVEATALLGVIASARRNFAEGVRLSELAIARNPNNLIALVNLGQLYTFELGKPEIGVTHFLRARELEPLDWIMHVNLGMAYAGWSKWPESYKCWQYALKLSPSRVEIWKVLGQYYAHESKYDSAAYWLKRVADAQPDENQTFEELGALYLVQNMYPDAERLLVLATTGELQDDYNLHYLLGVTYICSGKLRNARNAFEQGLVLVNSAVRQNPGNANHIASRGLFEARLQLAGPARRSAARAAEMDTADGDVIITLAKIHAILGDRANALRFFRKARGRSSEFDLRYLLTSRDFEAYWSDPEFRVAASGN